MDPKFSRRFADLWTTFFDGADLPIGFFMAERFLTTRSWGKVQARIVR